MPSKARAISATRHRVVNGGIAGLAKRMRGAANGPTQVKIGLPVGSADYPDGTSVVEVAATHEFGSEDGTIPERSWLRSSFRENLDDYRKMGAEIARAVKRGEMSMEKGLELLGTQAASDAQEMIVSISSPPNSAETIRRKGSSNPLDDTGHLRQQVTHQVVKKE